MQRARKQNGSSSEGKFSLLWTVSESPVHHALRKSTLQSKPLIIHLAVRRPAQQAAEPDSAPGSLRSRIVQLRPFVQLPSLLLLTPLLLLLLCLLLLDDELLSQGRRLRDGHARVVDSTVSLWARGEVRRVGEDRIGGRETLCEGRRRELGTRSLTSLVDRLRGRATPKRVSREGERRLAS